MMQRLICDLCGMAYDADQQRQHTDWHVDQRMKRLEPPADPVARHMLDMLTAALNKLSAAPGAVRHASWLPGAREAEAGR